MTQTQRTALFATNGTSITTTVQQCNDNVGDLLNDTLTGKISDSVSVNSAGVAIAPNTAIPFNTPLIDPRNGATFKVIQVDSGTKLIQR